MLVLFAILVAVFATVAATVGVTPLVVPTASPTAPQPRASGAHRWGRFFVPARVVARARGPPVSGATVVAPAPGGIRAHPRPTLPRRRSCPTHPRPPADEAAPTPQRHGVRRRAPTRGRGFAAPKLRIEWRPRLVANPVGSFSLAGMQPKVTAREESWPWAVCDGCGGESEGKVE